MRQGPRLRPRPVPGEGAMATEAPTVSSPRIAGTLAYLAPEQIRGERLDGRSDLHALGVLIYEMTTGRRPFAGDNVGHVLHATLHDPAPRLRAARPGLSAELEEIVARCLEKEPALRF